METGPIMPESLQTTATETLSQPMPLVATEAARPAPLHAHPAESVATNKMRSVADKLGICLSGLCLIHCLLTPVAMLLLPSIQVLELHEVVHEGLLFVLPVLAILAFVPGYRRHRNWRVFAWALPGFALILFSGLVLDHGIGLVQTSITIAGSALLIQAHVVNRRLCACCDIVTANRSRSRAGFRAVTSHEGRLLSRPGRR